MELARLVEAVEATRTSSRRTAKVMVLADVLRQATGRDSELAALYLAGELPQGRVGVGWRSLSAPLSAPQEAGAPLTLTEVDRVFGTLAAEGGAGSAERRRSALGGLFGRAGTAERGFLRDLVLGELRQGALAGLVLEAVARAAGLAAADVRRAAMFAPNVGAVARVALEEGRAGLDRFSLQVLKPVAPMLAASADSVAEALDRLGTAALEQKVDGARIQVHRSGAEARVYTRQLQDVSARVPEIVEWALELPAEEVVLEGEALALRADGRPQPFQVTMRRFGRSRGVEAARRERPLFWFLFDCLFLGGEGSLVAMSYADRYDRLVRLLEGERLLPRIVTANPAEAEAFLAEALAAGHEGIMAKSLSAPYVAGQRGFHWIKVKPAPTLDLVVLAAEWGSGRRKGWLSNLHLGARDAVSGEFVMLGKTFKGLTDAMLAWQTERLLALETSREEWVVRVRPELVVEVAFGEIQESPRYPAKLALRFARVKAHRPDKSSAEADTLDTVRELFERRRA